MLTAQDQELRKGKITSTRIAMIAGLSKYGGPIDAYQEILGISPEKETTVDMQRGHYLEDACLHWYRDQYGVAITPGKTAVHPQFECFAATPDGIAENGSKKIVIEAKSPREASHWGEANTDDIPDYHVCQVAWEMACLDMSKAHVVAYVNHEFRCYEIERDKDLENQLIEIAHTFWQKHIQSKTPPEADASKSYADFLARTFAKHNDNLIAADNEATAWAMEYFKNRKQREAYEEREEKAKNHLKKLIGDNYGMRGDGFTVVWREVKGQKSIAWQEIATKLGVTQDMIHEHTCLGKAHRRFNATLLEEIMP